jgi:hypothetical protein
MPDEERANSGRQEQEEVSIVREIPIMEHVRAHEALSKNQRENWSHYMGLAMLMLIGIGAFVLILTGKSDKVVDFSLQTLSTILGGLIAYPYIKK